MLSEWTANHPLLLLLLIYGALVLIASVASLVRIREMDREFEARKRAERNKDDDGGDAERRIERRRLSHE